MFEYQKNRQFTGTIAHGLEEEGVRELLELGAQEATASYRVVLFTCDTNTLMRILVMNRLFSRILVPIAQFHCPNDEALYQYANRRIDWSKLMNTQHTFSIFSTTVRSTITHSLYASLKLKDAIVDQFRQKTGIRPSVDRDNPDLSLNLFIQRNEATISLDMGHGSLHKRGYRLRMVDAPLQETLGAALIRISGWDGTRPLHDPFCGSGTILAEAGLQYCHYPPGLRHTEWGFQRLPDYSPKAWERLQQELRQQYRPLPEGLISGSDHDTHAIQACRTNLASLPFGAQIDLEQRDYRTKPVENAMIICNPPYGVRLDDLDKVKKMLKDFGDYLKQKCKGSTAWVLVGDKDLVPYIGLKPSRKVVLYNADIECRFVEIKVLEFTRREKPQSAGTETQS